MWHSTTIHKDRSNGLETLLGNRLFINRSIYTFLGFIYPNESYLCKDIINSIELQ